MILIQDYDEDVPNRGKPDEQEQFWIDVVAMSNGIITKFIQKFNWAVQVLDENKGEDGTECFVCEQSPTDVIFILDESNSMDQRYFFFSISTLFSPL